MGTKTTKTKKREKSLLSRVSMRKQNNDQRLSLSMNE
jgi:hypothetical protein